MHGSIKYAGQWLIDYAQNTGAVLGESDLDREVAVAVDEAVGAVEWIDHPHARLFETAFCVDRFFGEDAVVGKLAFETVDDQFVGDRVGLGNWLDVVRGRLLFYVKRAFVVLENRSPRCPRQLTGDMQFVIVGSLFRGRRHLKEFSRKGAKAQRRSFRTEGLPLRLCAFAGDFLLPLS